MKGSDEEKRQTILLQSNNQLFVYLEKRNNGYYRKIVDSLGSIDRSYRKIALAQDHEFEKGVTLGEILKKFQENDIKEMDEFFTIRRQLNIGTYLYNKLFGNWLDRQAYKRIATQVYIITNDEFLLQLPWVLLANNGIFLTAAGWQICQSPFLPQSEVVADRFMQILVILPQPKHYPSTEGKTHFSELKKLLYSIESDQVSTQYLTVVHTWKELEKAVRKNPEIIYYYGHGIYHEQTSSLILENKQKVPDIIPIIELRKLFVHLNVTPKIVYLNCCSGDTAGWLGVGNQLSEIVPVTITNRTTAYIDSSRQIAIDFFNDVLREGTPPAEALNHAILRLPQESIRFLTPVCYATYRDWKKAPVHSSLKVYRDSDWLITIDRMEQCARLVYQTMLMVDNKKPQSLGFIWYGEPGDGVTLFHKRVQQEIRKRLKNTVVLLDKTIEWPRIEGDLINSLEEQYCDTFEVKKLEDIRQKIGQLLPYISGKTRLISIHHESFDITENKRINAEYLEQYLHWWASRFLSCFSKDIHLLLVISFIVPPDKIETFSRRIKSILVSVATNQFVTTFLPQLHRLAEEDIIDFIRTHEIPIPENFLYDVTQKILSESKGKYEKTLVVLENIEKSWFKYITSCDKIESNNEW